MYKFNVYYQTWCAFRWIIDTQLSDGEAFGDSTKQTLYFKTPEVLAGFMECLKEIQKAYDESLSQVKN